MMAGGASFAPRRWSFPAVATEERMRGAWVSTALMTAVSMKRNFALSCGVCPGVNQFRPSVPTMDQLLCFPEPLTPANGFSCRRHAKPNFAAASWRVCMMSMLWSTERFCSSNTGASSNCPGLTSLCRVFAGTPRRQSRLSTSAMKARMRGLIRP